MLPVQDSREESDNRLRTSLFLLSVTTYSVEIQMSGDDLRRPIDCPFPATCQLSRALKFACKGLLGILNADNMTTTLSGSSDGWISTK
jgi:hypothetical protein